MLSDVSGSRNGSIFVVISSKLQLPSWFPAVVTAALNNKPSLDVKETPVLSKRSNDLKINSDDKTLGLWFGCVIYSFCVSELNFKSGKSLSEYGVVSVSIKLPLLSKIFNFATPKETLYDMSSFN